MTSKPTWSNTFGYSAMSAFLFYRYRTYSCEAPTPIDKLKPGKLEVNMEANVDNHTAELQHALDYAENIIATLREPFVVLDKSLRVRTCNGAFYRDFHVSKKETESRFVYELGDGQWDIPDLRRLLTQILTNKNPIEDFEVEHAFPVIGQRNMLLNARRFPPDSDDPSLVLLAIEDITDAGGRKPPSSTPKSGIGGYSRKPRTGFLFSTPTRGR